MGFKAPKSLLPSALSSLLCPYHIYTPGFGVCCTFTMSGCTQTVTENCTYIQNEGYPTAMTSTSTSCVTTFSREETSKARS